MAITTTMKIEWPVLNINIAGKPFYDANWQPNQKYWTGRTIKGIPEPYQAGPREGGFFTWNTGLGAFRHHWWALTPD